MDHSLRFLKNVRVLGGTFKTPTTDTDSTLNISKVTACPKMDIFRLLQLTGGILIIIGAR